MKKWKSAQFALDWLQSGISTSEPALIGFCWCSLDSSKCCGSNAGLRVSLRWSEIEIIDFLSAAPGVKNAKRQNRASGDHASRFASPRLARFFPESQTLENECRDFSLSIHNHKSGFKNVAPKLVNRINDNARRSQQPPLNKLIRFIYCERVWSGCPRELFDRMSSWMHSCQ